MEQVQYNDPVWRMCGIVLCDAKEHDPDCKHANQGRHVFHRRPQEAARSARGQCAQRCQAQRSRVTLVTSGSG